MATKYLARTIIEGGRTGFSKHDRNASHGEERALTRMFIAKAGALSDGFDALCIGVRPKAYKSFADKLGAPRRWLRSQVGRPWDKVRSEIFERFDPRNLAGQHIIFDHLLREVVLYGEVERKWSRQGLYVDRHGILRAPRPEPRQKPTRGEIERMVCAVTHWLSGRRIGGEGSSLFWLVEHSECGACRNAREAPCCCPIIDGTLRHGAHKHYRQAQRLTSAELAFWQSLHEDARCCARGSRRTSS